MLIVTHIDISNADLDLFDEYESGALQLLERYGARLEDRLRSTDARSEIHILYFPDGDALESFRADPVRAALQDIWHRSGAVSSLLEVKRLA